MGSQNRQGKSSFGGCGLCHDFLCFDFTGWSCLHSGPCSHTRVCPLDKPHLGGPCSPACLCLCSSLGCPPPHPHLSKFCPSPGQSPPGTTGADPKGTDLKVGDLVQVWLKHQPRPCPHMVSLQRAPAQQQPRHRVTRRLQHPLCARQRNQMLAQGPELCPAWSFPLATPSFNLQFSWSKGWAPDGTFTHPPPWEEGV